MPAQPRAVPVVVLHGPLAPDPTWLDALRAALPAGTPLAAAADWADLPADVGRLAGADPLAAARAAWPGSDLVLVRSDADLPPAWYARLERSLTDAVLVAGPLDNLDPARSPLPPGAHSALGAEAIDRACAAWGRRIALDAAGVSPLLSRWSGALLAGLDLDLVRDGRISGDVAPRRAVLLDHLYVAARGRPLRGPALPAAGAEAPPEATLGALRANVGAALAADAIPRARHGIDARPVVLHILHSWGGGAERFVRDLAAADTAHAHLVLVARGSFARRCCGEALELLDGSFAGPPLRRLPLARPIVDSVAAHADYREFLARVVADYAVDAVLVSSLIGHSFDALRTGLKTAVVLHDCYPLWPILHRDFGDPALPFDARQRESDLAQAGDDFEFGQREPRHWAHLAAEYAKELVAAQATLIAPSRTALGNVLRLAPALAGLAQHIVPHGLGPWPVPPADVDPPARPRLRLVVPGRVRRGKGAELLRAALPQLRAHAELFLLGAGAEGMDFFGERDVHVVLNYTREELPALVAQIRPDAALLAPTVAETFSYTLSECNSVHLPVVATRMGALAERIVDGEDGFLAAPTAESIVAVVARLAAERSALDRVRATLRARAPRGLGAMAADYARVLDLKPSADARYASGADSIALREALASADALLARRRELEALQTRAAALQRELDRRAEWAIDLEREGARAVAALRHTQDELEKRTAWAQTLNAEVERRHSEIEDLNGQIANAMAHIGHLEGVAQERERMLNSASWKLTRPLRYAKRKLRALQARLKFQYSRTVNLMRRGRASYARRGLSGTLQRLAQEFRRGRVAPVPVADAPNDDFPDFTLPAPPQAPRVSIVIPVYNKIGYTWACLRSIAEHAGDSSFEVVVVDDGSSDATQERLAEVAHLTYVRNAQNLGFVGSCNAGAAAARGEYVLFLNNDTVVTAGWLEALLACFAAEPDAGLVGAKLVYPDGRLQEAGGIVFSDGSGWNYGRFDDPADARYNFRREADYVSGAAIMLPRSLFDRLGGFDQRYAPAYYEDTDLAFAVRAAGLKVYYEPRSTVIHFEGVTAGTDTASGVKQYQVVNREKFLDKWKDALARQPAPIDDAKLAPRAATHRAQRRILIIDACTPTPDQDSGSLRMVNLMRLLRTLGWQATFFADNRAYVPGYTEALQALGVEVQYHPYMGDPIAFFRHRGGEFDAVLISRHYIAINYLGLTRLYAPRAKFIFDTVDLHYLREERAAALSGSADEKRRAATTRAQEQKLMRESDVTLVVSPVEKALLAEQLPKVRVEILSNVHEVYGRRTSFGERADLVFVGSFQHPPNVDAVLWFAREVLPRVKQELPQVKLNVIGQPAPPELIALDDPNVVVRGFVSDLAPYMDGCRVSVAPLRYGAGVKGKVNMAMSYGLPVVATPIAVEGMAVEAGRDALVAETAVDYAEAVVRLYRDEALWERLSDAGLANVTRHFSFEAAQGALRKILG